MTSARRWSIAAAVLVALLAAAWLAMALLVPSNDELARRVEAEFETRFGQKLVVGSLRWQLLGGAVVEVRDAHTVQPEGIRVRRVAIHPELMPLLRRQWIVDRLEVEGAVVPRNAMVAYRGKAREQRDGPMLRTLAFTEVTYVSCSGIPVVYLGEVRFDEDRVPRRFQIHRPDVEQIDAQGKVELAGGVVEVPFSARGPTRQPEVKIAWGTKIGGALSGRPKPPPPEPQAP